MIKLLHVEDDPDIREIAEMSLGLSGEFDLMQCDSGESALTCVQDFMPDVLLLDMMMPGMTGSQTLEKIREMPTLVNTPAIFMTARAQHGEIEDLLKAGAAEVISKPFDPMTLGEQIKAVIAKSG